MAKTPEGKVKEEVTRLLKSLAPGVHYWMPVPFGYGKSGVDYHGTVRGFAFVIETKAFGQVPTKKQEQFMKQFADAGGQCFVITGRGKGDLQLPRGLRELECWLRDMLRKYPAYTTVTWR